MDAKQALEDFRDQIEPLIENFFDEAIAEAQEISLDSEVAVTRLREYTLRKAKRVRPALMYYTYKMLGGENSKEILKTAVSLELLQSYLLIHDDMMDQDEIRRGKPTMHKIYEADHKTNYDLGEPHHFGESMAVNVGDIACHLSLQIIAESKFPAEGKIKALAKLHHQISSVGQGQMLDILNSVKSDVTTEDVLKVHHYKTAKYTFETPMTLGGIFAGASASELRLISEYAINAGIAFQIQDDILGMFGSEEKLGKPNTSDLREGKRTLLIIKALEKGTPRQVSKIATALGNSNLTAKRADEVRKIIRDTGSLDYSKQLAEEYVTKAKAVLAKANDWSVGGKAFLDGIADYMINREF